jgi:hypothetical protein
MSPVPTSQAKFDCHRNAAINSVTMSATIPPQPINRKRLATKSSLIMPRMTLSPRFTGRRGLPTAQLATVIYLTVYVAGLTDAPVSGLVAAGARGVHFDRAAKRGS